MYLFPGFCNFLYFLCAYYHSRSRIPMEAALEILNQTFVSILSGNFISICTGVVVHVGLPLAAERQFVGRYVHSRTSQLRIDQTRRHAYQLDYQLFVCKHSGCAQHNGRKPGKIAFIMARELHGLYKWLDFKRPKR